ncbi:MAG: ATP-binding protein, partial [Gemmatimonadaceae bacterium]
EEQRRFIEKIIDSLPVGLYVIDRAFRIQAWNRKRETGMLGVSREEAIGRTIFEILHRQPAQRLREEFDDVFATGAIRQFDMESAALGELRTYRVTKIPMALDDAGVSHVITIGEDTTAWTGAQARMAQSEKLAAVGQLAAGVMHEINNPLATIGACGESMTLRLEEPDTDARMRDALGDYLRIIDLEVHRCKRIIDGLLDFSRPKEPVLMPADINLVLDETLFLLKHHSAFRRMRVDTHFDRALPLVSGNSERLIQVFMALLLNACDASAGAGRIDITTSRESSAGDAVVIAVRDDGHGIPRSEISKIFDPFYTTKPPGRGTGLGLSICYAVIADHGGRIEVDSTPPAGTTFRVVLPVGDAAASLGGQRA